MVGLPTLRQLEYVVALAETGRFVDAARRCGVSQPALSKQLREVEEQLGVQLFERSRPRALPTATGRLVVERAKALLRDARDLTDMAAGASGAPVGTIRLGVIPTVAPYGLPGLLAKLRHAYPDVSFAIHELQTETLLKRLGWGEIDLGLLARPFEARGLAGVDVVREPFVFVAPTGHALAKNAEIRASELSGQSLILMEDGHCLRDQAVDVCGIVGAPPPTSVAAASVSTLVRMVESGLGPTLLPASALATEVRAEQGLVARSFGTNPPGRTLALQWRNTTRDDTWNRHFASVLRRHYVAMNAEVPPVAGAAPQILSCLDGHSSPA